eukprot:GFUD01015849.1.p1 GENE.GFUD01015849.1~~GFUD01015849.1.p1  ORF type:complete len:227 (-),score=93.17 GFUD01015849.1:79-759(-)
MPKKMAGENSKAVAARERKNEKVNADKAAKDAATEDAKWADNDKGLAKKQGRKEDAEKKRLEALAKKKEREDMLAQETAGISVKQAKVTPMKITQAQIREEQAKREEAAKGKAVAKPEPVTHLTTPLPENINRVDVEGAEARNVTEAIQVLSINANSPSVDKHPEKRMKAAFEEFEKKRLPELKAENGNMRLSQLKQMLRKEWQKHPENPLNKQLAAMAGQMANQM